MKALVPLAAVIAVLSSGAPAARAEDPAQRQCPEILRGVSLSARPVTGGVALEFTTPRLQEVPELRQQLREAALLVEMHSKASVQPAADGGEQVRIPPLDISVNDVGAGAHVIIRAQRASDLPEIMALAHALELFWARSDCSRELGTRSPVAMPFQRA